MNPRDLSPGLQEDSLTLLQRAQSGDRQALEELLGRYLPRLQRWARGRLPRHARDVIDTSDLVQDTLMRSVKALNAFEPRNEASLELYLRRAVVNRLRDELRRVKRAPRREPLADELPAPAPSPLDQAIGQQDLARYVRALSRLAPHEREAVVARLELGYSYKEVAVLVGKPTPDAARVAVARAVIRLADLMDHGD